MKNSIKILSLLFIALFTFSSCSKDDDPVDNDLFAGTYKGDVGYLDGSTNISEGDGSVVVTKFSSDTYNFKFSNSIPDLNGIKMQKGDNNTIFFGDGTLGSITISEKTLKITYAKDGKTWSADCTR